MEEEDKSTTKETKPPKVKFVARTPTEMQRIKLEKMMEHPEKPIIIPSIPKEKKFLSAIPTFVRNVMGSSAGAGSGEFHVYRHLRRKEYARQKYIQHQSRQEELDDEYQQKLEQNRLDAEEKTAKKRAKRLKKKKNQKRAKNSKSNQNNKPNDEEVQTSSSDDAESEAEEQNPEENPVAHQNSNLVDESNEENKQIENVENNPNILDAECDGSQYTGEGAVEESSINAPEIKDKETLPDNVITTN